MDAEFRFDVEIPVRYRDLDTLGHVNNAVYATYLEQARAAYVDRVLGMDLEDDGMVLASLKIDFRRPVDAAVGSIRVECGAVSVGDSSFRMGYRVHDDGDDEPAATAESVQVAWDGASSRSLPAAWRESLRAFEPGLS
ncbi:acyl-CoA thioesterase [Halobacteriales archaeon QS_9_70_65]|nr:MAG: acyl-CoA thioesterase [Halobacteriales archaeon QS_9_70_65]